MQQKTVYLLTLGCDKNTVDSEFILGDLIKAGFNYTENIKEADLVIVNTCCFIEEARVESINAIFDCINSKSKEAKIIVTGCLVERYKEELIKEIPEIDGFFSLNEQDKILDFLDSKITSNNRVRFTPVNSYAYLKISEGCNRNCSYCSIPLIRGKHHSFDKSEIFKQAQKLEESGVKELILVAQDLTQYGNDLNNYSFNELLKEIAEKFDFKWIRLLYLYPEGIDQELLKIIKTHPNIIPYFDIPIQHTNNRILKLMNRSITKDRIKELVRNIRKELPNAIIRSTVIVGFPTETQEEFEELKEDLIELQLDRLGSFAYSQEEGTKAYNLIPQITQEEKEKRVNEITILQSKIMQSRNENLINKKFDCLIEEKIDNNTYTGRLYSDAPEIDCITYINSVNNLNIGSFYPVVIRDVLDYDLIGDFVDPK